MRILRFIASIMTVSAAVLPTRSLQAQSSARQSRAIHVPDTLGANFLLADSATGTSNSDDLDFLVGMWHFRFQQRNLDGTFNPPFDGHWSFERMRVSNGVIVDHWRRDNPETTIQSGTWSYRTYNPRRKIWEMQGTNTGGDGWLPGLMWSDASNRYVIQHYGPNIVRFRYFSIEPNRFLWRADVSTDQGKTWLLDRWTMEVVRVAR